MNKKPKAKQNKDQTQSLPFDDALRQILKAKPQHKPSTGGKARQADKQEGRGKPGEISLGDVNFVILGVFH